jgi:tetratricopeptide (TPR) repeat protein
VLPLSNERAEPERILTSLDRKKIYKTKIKEWDIGKRLNDDDVLAILHLRAQREAAAKQSEFWIMGKRVNEVNISRYLKRKPQILARYRRGHRPQNPHELVRLVCVTPPPPPEAVWRLPPGTTLAEAEGLLMDCRDYFRSSWDSGEWKVEDDGVVIGVRAGRKGAEITDDVLSKFYTAADLLYRSNFPGAFKVLDLAFRGTGEIVSANVPRLLSLLLIVFDRLNQRGQRDTLNILRKYVQSQADSIGNGNGNKKLPIVLKRISALEIDKYDDVFPRVFDLMIEQSDDTFGPGGNLSLEIYWHMFGSYIMRRDTVGQVRSLKKELDKIPTDAGPHPWVLRHQRLYAWKISQVMRDQGRFDEAQEALRSVEHTYADGSQSLDASRHWLFAAMIELGRDDWEAAEKYFRLSVRMAMNTTDEDGVQYSLFRLSDVLDQMGRGEEAEKVREYARDRIAEIAAQVQWNWDEFQARTAVEPVIIPSPEEGPADLTS